LYSWYQNISILDFIGAKNGADGGDNWSYKTCKAPVNVLMVTNTQLLYRLDALPVALIIFLMWTNCCLQYMEQLLINYEFLEFFVEGGRTRSGKPLVPKGGLLSVVMDAVASGTVKLCAVLLLWFCFISCPVTSALLFVCVGFNLTQASSERDRPMCLQRHL